MKEFISTRIIDGKLRKIIVDENENITNMNPSKEELKGIEKFPEINRHRSKYTKGKIIEIIRRFERENGRSPTSADFDDNLIHYPSSWSVRNLFGSWNNAMRMAGLIPNILLKDEELLEFLRKFDRENGRSPKMEDFLGNPKYPSFATYQKRFGSWNGALKIAGLDINRFTKTTNEELLRYLQEFYDIHFRPPTQLDFNSNPKYPSFGVYIDRFESWEDALRLVGLDIDSMVRKGIIETENQKGRLFEIFVLEHFVTKDAIDLSGENRSSFADGICPKGQVYDAKSIALKNDCYTFVLKSKYREKIDYFYLGAFDKDYSRLDYVWRIPGGFTDNDYLTISLYGYRGGYSVDNMKEYETTPEFTEIFENWMDNIQKNSNYPKDK